MFIETGGAELYPLLEVLALRWSEVLAASSSQAVGIA